MFCDQLSAEPKSNRHSFCCGAYVAFWHFSDVTGRAEDVRSWGCSGHDGVAPLLPFLTQLRQIIRLAEQHRVPAIYSYRSFVAEGGLISYGADQYDIFRRSASYVDRILKGARPADLPVQQPTKFELAINLKTARALGLSVPLSMQQLADEVIE